MPQEEYSWLPRAEILMFDEIVSLVSMFTINGVGEIHITGGEPPLRPQLPKLIDMLASNDKIRDLALTTNGVLLSKFARDLRTAGLRRVTVGLSTLRSERFTSLTKRNTHSEVLSGIEAAHRAGFEKVKINTVVLRGFNDDELGDWIEFERQVNAEVRFIEYLDVGGATGWAIDSVVSRG